MKHSIGSIVERLAEQRKLQLLSQEALGSKVGLKQAYVSEIENGKRDSRLSIIIDIARVLGFELMLIPRPLIPAVNQLIATHFPSEATPTRSTYQSLLSELGDNEDE